MSFIKRLLGIKTANKNAGMEETKVDFEVKDMKKGYVFDYDMQSWEVLDVSVYEWDNGVKDYEYTISDGKGKSYLNYESASNKLSIYWDASLNEIWEDARRRMRAGLDMQSQTFKYKGASYYFAGEGAARVRNSKEIFQMQNWLFESDTEGLLVSFNKYEDNSMEAYVGKKLPDYAVTNILRR